MMKSLRLFASIIFTLAPFTFACGEEMQTFMGVGTEPVHPEVQRYLELPEGFGIQVSEVVNDSPAEKAGLKKGDVLTLFGDQRLISGEHLVLLVRELQKGDEVEVTVLRKGDERRLKLILGERAAPIASESQQFSRYKIDEYIGDWAAYYSAIRTKEPDENLNIDGDETSFDEEEGIAIASGNVAIYFGHVRIFCESARFSQETGLIEAKGNVEFREGDHRVKGTFLTYDINTGEVNFGK